MASITSVELNYLVFRYLQESGFTHSAFAFGYEASINKCQIDGSLVPPGALVTFVQKGLQYLEMEANLSNADSDVDDDFSFLQPLDLITKDVYELRRTIKERRKNELKKTKEKELDKQHEEAHGLVKDREKQVRKREREKETERTEEKPREKEHSYHNDKEVDTNHEDQKNVRNEENGVSGGLIFIVWILSLQLLFSDAGQLSVSDFSLRLAIGPEPMEISTTYTSQIVELTSCDVMILEGHTSEVCACAWSPSGSLLASGESPIFTVDTYQLHIHFGSGDSTARIWRIGDGTNQSSTQNGPAGEIVLLHVKAKTNEKSKDVTAIDWNIDGTLLATGSYDGQARIWSTDGELKSTLTRHKGPIFSLKWNKKCEYIVTGSCDKTAVVWDVKTEGFKQQFEFHSGPILDVDWRNNVSFATSSTDHMIYVCKIGETSPIKTFSDHQGEVNCLKWDPTGTLLASCSDDVTAKIWSLKQDKCIHDFKEHDKEIYTIRWSPTGPGTNNPNLPLLLASASFDSTVKLWDVEQGRLLCSLNGHREPVYSVAFSPNGEYLASGSLDKSVLIWSLKESKIIKRYTGNGGIFEVCWNKEGDKIAACFANNIVCVLDFRK